MYRILIGIPVMASLFMGAAFSQIEKDEQKIAKAREALRAARGNLDETRDRLEKLYLHLEAEFEKLSGQYSVQFIHGLETAWMGRLKEIRTRWDLEAARGRGVSRRRDDRPQRRVGCGPAAPRARLGMRIRGAIRTPPDIRTAQTVGPPTPRPLRALCPFWRRRL